MEINRPPTSIVSSREVLGSNGLVIANAQGQQEFKIDGTTGAVTIGGPAVASTELVAAHHIQGFTDGDLLSITNKKPSGNSVICYTDYNGDPYLALGYCGTAGFYANVGFIEVFSNAGMVSPPFVIIQTSTYGIGSPYANHIRLAYCADGTLRTYSRVGNSFSGGQFDPLGGTITLSQNPDTGTLSIPVGGIIVNGGSSIISDSSSSSNARATGLSVAYNHNNTFSANSDAGDAQRTLSVSNESTASVGNFSCLSFRTLTGNGAPYSAVMDMKLVGTGSDDHRFYMTMLGSGGFLDVFAINAIGNATFSGTISPQQHATSGAPSYVKGAMYFDTTLNKLRIGGASAWETVTSV